MNKNRVTDSFMSIIKSSALAGGIFTFGFIVGAAEVFNSAIDSRAAYFHPNHFGIVWGQPTDEGKAMAVVQSAINACLAKGDEAKGDLLCNLVAYEDEGDVRHSSNLCH